MFFPHDTIRQTQKRFHQDVQETLKQGKILLAHAPTGMGKTAAALSPAIEHARSTNKKVFFLTSRHTQHAIALETIRQLQEKHHVSIPTSILIAKRHYCLQQAEDIPPKDFTTYCRTLREAGNCEHYKNSKKQDGSLSTSAKTLVAQLKHEKPHSSFDLKERCQPLTLCPYEITTSHAKQSTVIIGDYNYLFHPAIRASLFSRMQLDISQCILVIDEAHNLTERIREAASISTSTLAIERALTECENYNLNETATHLRTLRTLLSKNITGEVAVSKELLLSAFDDYEHMLETLHESAEHVLNQQQHSSIHSIHDFLEKWQGDDEGHVRILQKTPRDVYMLHYRCLDPALLSEDVFSSVASAILMSGTLEPTEMHKDLLGIYNCAEKAYPSPFPAQNRLSLVIPQTSTQYTLRTPDMYRKIATLLSHVSTQVPGNVAFFFPSYELQQQIGIHLQEKTNKPLLYERSFSSPSEKSAFLQDFKNHSKQGAVLLGVMGANFAEGIDLPGELLNAVVIIGLPLGRPDLETKALIDYYQDKFGNGWGYGYVLPAFIKTLQGAGRCLRTEQDRGAIIFLDSRYAEPRYYQLFPEDWDVKITTGFVQELQNFFKQ